MSQLNQKKAIKVVFSVGSLLLHDLAREEMQEKTLKEYGENLLKIFPELLQFANYKKEVKQ